MSLKSNMAFGTFLFVEFFSRRRQTLSPCGRGAEKLPVCSGKRSVALKTALKAGVRGWNALRDKFSGKQQSAFREIGVDGCSRFFTEAAHHMVAAEIKPVDQIVNTEILCQMGVQIADNLQNPLIFRKYGCRLLHALILNTPADFD